MLDTPPATDATARLWLPRRPLTSCLRAVIGRRTTGLALPDLARFNHFPASPLCSITWWLAGTTQVLPTGIHRGQAATCSLRCAPAGTVAFGGPQSGPSLSWNDGPVHGLMALLAPDAVHLLTGLNPADWVNRLVDARQVLPPDWLAMSTQVLQATDDEQRVQTLQDFLEPRWQAARPAGVMAGHRYQDWAQHLALRAATSATGRSLRQMERRVRQWAGLPMRELRGLGRAEQAFFQARTSAEQSLGAVPWADVAAATGYADQSHLTRETRRVTGFAPQDLLRRIQRDESFWCYRVWQ